MKNRMTGADGLLRSQNLRDQDVDSRVLGITRLAETFSFYANLRSPCERCCAGPIPAFSIHPHLRALLKRPLCWGRRWQFIRLKQRRSRAARACSVARLAQPLPDTWRTP